MIDRILAIAYLSLEKGCNLNMALYVQKKQCKVYIIVAPWPLLTGVLGSILFPGRVEAAAQVSGISNEPNNTSTPITIQSDMVEIILHSDYHGNPTQPWIQVLYCRWLSCYNVTLADDGEQTSVA